MHILHHDSHQRSSRGYDKRNQISCKIGGARRSKISHINDSASCDILSDWKGRDSDRDESRRPCDAISSLDDKRMVRHVSQPSNSVEDAILNDESQPWGGLLSDERRQTGRMRRAKILL